MNAPALRLSLGLDTSQLAAASETTAHFVCEVETLEHGVEASRPPITVMLAIDVSGSMQGPPIEAVSSSVRRLVSLLEPTDRVGLVAFSDSASVIAPPAPLDAPMRQLLIGRVTRLAAGGQTNVEAGLRAAASALPKRAPDERQVIVLLSDGCPNVGTSDAAGLQAAAAALRPDVTLSTLGYGIKHDEDVLLALARGGGGRYTFVADPQVASLGFAQALGAAGDVVAEAVELLLRPASGVEITRVLSDPPSRVSAGGLVLPLPDAIDGMSQIVVAELRIRVGREPGRMPLITAELSYRGAGRVDVERTSESLSADVGRIQGPPAAPIRAKVFLARTDETRARARALADRGQWGGAAALIRALLDAIKDSGAFTTGDGSPLSEAYEQLLDEAVAYERRPAAEAYAAFRKSQVMQQFTHGGDKLKSHEPKSVLTRIVTSGLVGEVGDAWLVIVGGAEDGKRIPLRADQTIGRTSQADIVISDQMVSRRHAAIVALEGDFFVLDLGSANATLVNGKPIDTRPHRLVPGDVIQIGPKRLRFESKRTRAN